MAEKVRRLRYALLQVRRIIFELSQAFFLNMAISEGKSWTPIYILITSLYIWLFSSRTNENVLAKNLFKKLTITISSLIFMVLSKDSKGVGPKYNPDPELIKGRQLGSKVVIFVRYKVTLDL